MKTFGLIGRTLTHSFSKRYFTDKFVRDQIINCKYENFPLEEITAFPQLKKDYPGLTGLNVTIPYKQSVIPFLTRLDGAAAAIGAVNTIHFSDKEVIGYNTDWVGFLNSIKPHLDENRKRALVLGDGGAAKAVCYVFDLLGISYQVVRRSAGSRGLDYDALNAEHIEYNEIIVNCTPLGTSPDIHGKPNIPYSALDKRHLLVDLVYNPPETSFLKEGILAGASTVNGYNMLIHQAEASWEIWNKS